MPDTVMPGCIGVSFKQTSIVGNFVDTDGTRCDLGTGSASRHIPTPDVTPSPEGPSMPFNAATGSFMLDCARADGTHLQLDGRFVIPTGWTFLAC